MKLRAGLTVIWLFLFLVGIAAHETRKESFLVRRRLTKSSRGRDGSKGKENSNSKSHKSNRNGSKSKWSSGDKSGGKSKGERSKSKGVERSASTSKGSSGKKSEGKSKNDTSKRMKSKGSSGSKGGGKDQSERSGKKSEGKSKNDTSKRMKSQGSSGSKGGGKDQSESRKQDSSGSKSKGKGQSESGSKGCGYGVGKGKGGSGIVHEGEKCGEDTNGGCFSNPPVYGSIKLGQSLVGEYGSVWDTTMGFYKQDTDWFLFEVDKPGTCVQATLNSVDPGIVILYEGGSWEASSCSENLTDVASGDSTGIPAVYCFSDAGEYGVFVAPEFADESPCEDEPNGYTLTLDHLTCGTCHVEHESPGCYDMKCEKTVCEIDVSCCNDAWNASCVAQAKRWCHCTVVDKPGCDDSGRGKGEEGSGIKDKESKSKNAKSNSKKGSKESNAERGKKRSKGTEGKGSKSKSSKKKGSEDKSRKKKKAKGKGVK